jgi:hypothetical protein
MLRTSQTPVLFITTLMLALYAGILRSLPAIAQEKPAPLAAMPADPRIAAALREVSADRIRENIRILVGFGTRLTLSAGDPDSGRGIGAARAWIQNEFSRYSQQCGGCLEVKLDSFTQPVADRIPQPTEIVNVYAVLKGTDPGSAQPIVLVTGHYDSRNSETLDTKGDAPGANDDASGTAVSLECARVLSKLKFPATIIFLTVAGEEQGLNGSVHFAEMARHENWNLEAVLNNDIVGGDKSPGQDPTTVRVFSEGLPLAADDNQLHHIRSLSNESDSSSRELARYIAATSRVYNTGLHPTLIFRLDRFLRGGDHSAFNEQGFAGVRFTEFRENFDRQHQNVRIENGVQFGDLPQFVDYDYVARVARLNAATLASLASAPAPPAKVRLDTSKLENTSTLFWEASPGGHAGSYQILWRATSSPDWEYAQNAGTALRATVPVSKDNVIFGVRAVDAEGHPSMAVVPEPSR